MNKKLLVFIALFTITISGIGVDLYSPSLPWIAQSMNISQAFAKYTMTTFLIGFAMGQIIFGILSDMYGRKWILSFGIFIFVLSSFFAAFSKNSSVLMMMRFIQGLGAASCSVIAKTLLTDSLKGKKLHHAIVSLAIAWAGTPLLLQ